MDNADELFLTVELKGAYIDKKTVAIEEGLKVLFEEIPVGTVVKAEGTAFRKENDKNIILYKGETDEITIAEDENALALVLLPYEDIDDTSAENLIGTKQKPTSVGDIVFSDGSAIAYSADLTLTDEQKAAVIAVIFYAGTECSNNGESRVLGVGLKQSADEILWTTNTTLTAVSSINAHSSSSGAVAAKTATFTGDNDGSDNWSQMQSELSDTGTSGKYPAWEWVHSEYASDWYIPSLAELCMLYRAVSATDSVMNNAIQMLNGTQIEGSYWTSSLNSTTSPRIFDINFSTASINTSNSVDGYKVCAIREF